MSTKFSGFTAGGALGDADEVVGLSTAQNRRWTLLQVWNYISSKTGVFAPLASPALTGTPTAPTAAPATNTTQIATTAFVDAVRALLAPLASPALTGAPTAPTPTAPDRSTKIATTEFVNRDHWWVAGRGANIVHTGTTAETTLATINIPAGALGTTGQVRITSQTSAGANNANAKTVRTKFGGSAFQSVSLASTLTNRNMRQVANKNAANAQVSYPAGAGTDGSANAAPATMAIDTSVSFDITITVQLANAGDTVTLDYYTVEVLY